MFLNFNYYKIYYFQNKLNKNNENTENINFDRENNYLILNIYKLINIIIVFIKLYSYFHHIYCYINSNVSSILYILYYSTSIYDCLNTFIKINIIFKIYIYLFINK